MKNVLIIAAHYDDAELGCGGTAKYLVENNCNVYKLTLTDNVTNYSQMNITIDYESSKRESKEASNLLGVKEIDEFIPERCCELYYNTALMQRIEDIICNYDIDTVFTHYPSDINNDHIEASKLSLVAARHCENIFYYYSNAYLLPNGYNPNIFFDITNYYDKKIEALSKYGKDHNRFDSLFETVLKRNEIWGHPNNVKYAEGFVAYKCIANK